MESQCLIKDREGCPLSQVKISSPVAKESSRSHEFCKACLRQRHKDRCKNVL